MQGFRSPNFGRRREAPRTINKVIDAKVAEVFANRFKEEDFINRPYGKADVDADIALVKGKEIASAKTKTPEEREAKELANLFEVIVLLGVKEAQWLGSKATAFKTSKYDDSFNDVDMLVDFREKHSPAYLGIAADVTFSSDRSVIAKKFASLRDKIKRGILTQIKYFHSEDNHFDGQLSNQPEVVIGVSARTVRELASLLAEGKYQDLSQHRAVVLILIQIEAQLNTFERYARSMNKLGVARIFANRLELIRGILADKAALVARVKATASTDPVHQEIMGFVENWSRY